MKRIALSALAGFLVCLGVIVVIDAARFAFRSPTPSASAINTPLTPLHVDPSWITSGNPVFKANETSRSPDGRSITGLWSCEGPTTFVWEYAVDETVHLLEGEVAVEYQGNEFVLRPGDTAVFHADTKARWTIDEYAKKVYTLQGAGPLGQEMRMLVPSAS